MTIPEHIKYLRGSNQHDTADAMQALYDIALNAFMELCAPLDEQITRSRLNLAIAQQAEWIKAQREGK